MGIKINTALVILFVVFINLYLIMLAQGVELFSWAYSKMYPSLADFAKRAGLDDPLIQILTILLILSVLLAVVLSKLGKE